MQPLLPFYSPICSLDELVKTPVGVLDNALTVTSLGFLMASKSFKISYLCFIDDPCADNNPFSFQIAPCACITLNVYFESVQILFLPSFPVPVGEQSVLLFGQMYLQATV